MQLGDESKRLLREAPYALAPFALYLATAWTYFGDAPVLDGMIFFRESLTLHASGLAGMLAERGGSTHPPLLFALVALTSAIFGRSPFAYSALGALIAALLSLAVYALARRHLSPKNAALSTAFVLSSPMLVACEVYPVSETLMVLGMVLGLLALETKNRILLAIAGAILVLLKSTALILFATLVIAVLLRDGARRLLLRTSLWRLGQRLLPFLPALVLLVGWKVLLSSAGGREWDSQVLEGEGGSPYVVLAKRFATLAFLDVRFAQNLQNALFVNFQWLSVLALIASATVFWRKRKAPKSLPSFLLVALGGALAYVLVPLTFPTWTVPRYSLPVIVLLNLCTPFLVPDRLRPALVLGVGLNLVATFTSVDPLTRWTFGTFRAHGETLYDLDYAWRGPDRAMYNLQLAAMARRQDAMVRNACTASADVIVDDCFDLKLGERLWSIGLSPDAYPAYSKTCPRRCFPVGELTDINKTGELKGRHVYVADPRNKEIVRAVCSTCSVSAEK